MEQFNITTENLGGVYDIKKLRSDGYNYDFNMQTGFFSRWGKTYTQDPQFSPLGPEIADIEITTSCNGVGGKLCPFCYKSNTPKGKNMSLETFKKVFAVLNQTKTLTQIAFGADSQAKTNPEIWDIMQHCRDNGVVPNITVAEVDDETASKLHKYCGAVAVSYYDPEVCFDGIQKLTHKGMTQVNMHVMLAEETFPKIYGELLQDLKYNERLRKLNAVVFLSLKKKGRGTKYNPLSQELFKMLIDKCLEMDLRIGFDSCSCHKFLKAVEGHEHESVFKMMSEPCESTLFSIYVDVDGKVHPCSFTDGKCGSGIDLKEDGLDLLKDVWMHPGIKQVRERVIESRDKGCLFYEI